jgi:hypothetical protein
MKETPVQGTHRGRFISCAERETSRHKQNKARLALPVKPRLTNNTDRNNIHKGPSALDPNTRSPAPTHSAASREPIGSRHKGHRSIERFQHPSPYPQR